MVRKNRNRIIPVIIIAFSFVTLFLFKKKNATKSEGFGHFKVEAFQQPTGWGYRIYQDTTAVIEQSLIPGVAGKKGFDTKEAALKTGKLVEEKLSKGIFPPTITPHELDSLGIQY